MAEWLTVEEICDYLKIHKMTIYWRARNGKMPASKLGGQWRFNKERIDKWLVEQEKNKKSIIEEQ